MWFFPRNLGSLPALPHHQSAAIVCTKTYQQIGVTVYSHFDESFEGLLQRCEKTQFFLNTLYLYHVWCCLLRQTVKRAGKNKCSNRSMEVKLPALLENYDIQTDIQPTNWQMDWPGHREVSIPTILETQEKVVIIL